MKRILNSILAIVTITACSSCAPAEEVLTSTFDTGSPETIPEAVIEAVPEAPAPLPVVIESVLHDVPFTPQAPFGEWSDPRQQDGCEEASALMAVAWARGTTLSYTDAKKEIIAMAEYENTTYGSNKDTDVDATASRLLKEYMNFTNYEIIYTPTEEQLKEFVQEQVIIMPAQGQRLGNPYFTAPGPETHMLVIIGYDKTKDEFITNDPGTRRGQYFRYSPATIMKAMYNYPTNKQEASPYEKAIIVVSKES